MGRTWGGVALMVGGLLVPVQTETCVVLFGSGGCVKETYALGVAIAVGMIGSGLLLATVWSDIPANPSIDFAVSPDRVQVGKSFGW